MFYKGIIASSHCFIYLMIPCLLMSYYQSFVETAGDTQNADRGSAGKQVARNQEHSEHQLEGHRQFFQNRAAPTTAAGPSRRLSFAQMVEAEQSGMSHFPPENVAAKPLESVGPSEGQTDREGHLERRITELKQKIISKQNEILIAKKQMESKQNELFVLVNEHSKLMKHSKTEAQMNMMTEGSGQQKLQQHHRNRHTNLPLPKSIVGGVPTNSLLQPAPLLFHPAQAGHSQQGHAQQMTMPLPQQSLIGGIQQPEGMNLTMNRAISDILSSQSERLAMPQIRLPEVQRLQPQFHLPQRLQQHDPLQFQSKQSLLHPIQQQQQGQFPLAQLTDASLSQIVQQIKNPHYQNHPPQPQQGQFPFPQLTNTAVHQIAERWQTFQANPQQEGSVQSGNIHQNTPLINQQIHPHQQVLQHHSQLEKHSTINQRQQHEYSGTAGITSSFPSLQLTDSSARQIQQSYNQPGAQEQVEPLGIVSSDIQTQSTQQEYTDEQPHKQLQVQLHEKPEQLLQQNQQGKRSHEILEGWGELSDRITKRTKLMQNKAAEGQLKMNEGDGKQQQQERAQQAQQMPQEQHQQQAHQMPLERAQQTQQMSLEIAQQAQQMPQERAQKQPQEQHQQQAHQLPQERAQQQPQEQHQQQPHELQQGNRQQNDSSKQTSTSSEQNHEPEPVVEQPEADQTADADEQGPVIEEEQAHFQPEVRRSQRNRRLPKKLSSDDFEYDDRRFDRP